MVSTEQAWGIPPLRNTCFSSLLLLTRRKTLAYWTLLVARRCPFRYSWVRKAAVWCWEATINTPLRNTPLRSVVGACVLVTGLLSGSACVAIASADDDTGSDSRTGSSQTTAGHSAGAPGSRLTDRRSGPLTKAAGGAVRGITGTLDSIGKQALQRPTVTRPLPSPPEADDTVPSGSPTDTNDSDVFTSETEFARRTRMCFRCRRIQPS